MVSCNRGRGSEVLNVWTHADEESYRDLEGAPSFKESAVLGMDWSDRYYEYGEVRRALA